MNPAVVTLKKGEGRLLKSGGAWIFDNEISAVAVKELGDLAMPWSEPRVRFGDVDAFSVNVTLTVYIWPDASIADAVDLISRGLEGKPWQAGMS